MSERPTPALSIRQPWAWAIIYAGKDIENRTWPTRYRGPVFIHAAKAFDTTPSDARACADEWARQAGIKPPAGFDLGGIIGRAEIIDCVTESASPWFVGRFGFVLANARPLPFTPCRGALGLFQPFIPTEHLEAIR